MKLAKILEEYKDKEDHHLLFLNRLKTEYELPIGGLINSSRHLFPSGIKKINFNHIKDTLARIEEFREDLLLLRNYLSYGDVPYLIVWIDR